MNVTKKLLNKIPFYVSYQSRKAEKTALQQQESELKMQAIRNRFYKQFVQSGDLVFDVGANVGNRVSSFLSCRAKVIAIEPQPHCVSILKEKFNDSIIIENVGLGSEHGKLKMYIGNESTVSTFSKEFIDHTKKRFKYNKWNNTLDIEVITLDDLILKYGIPQFCKIDVEGFEAHVLRGLHHPIPYISIEYCVPEMHQNTIECIEYLHQLSPVGSFNYCVGESMEFSLRTWQDYSIFKDHILSKKFIATSFGDIYFKSFG